MRTIKSLEDMDIKQVEYARKKPIMIRVIKLQERIIIETREGSLVGEIGDYLAEGIDGEVYPIGNDIFNRSYDIC